MASALEARLIDDVRLIKAFLRLPEIWETIGEDEPELSIDLENEFYLGMFVDSRLIGIYVLESRSSVCLQIHANVLKDYRRQYSKKTGEAALSFIINQIPSCKKVVARIPSLYKNVYEFTKSFGFKDEGLNRLSYKKNGGLWDVHQLGITRSEIEEYLDE